MDRTKGQFSNTTRKESFPFIQNKTVKHQNNKLILNHRTNAVITTCNAYLKSKIDKLRREKMHQYVHCNHGSSEHIFQCRILGLGDLDDHINTRIKKVTMENTQYSKSDLCINPCRNNWISAICPGGIKVSPCFLHNRLPLKTLPRAP